LLTPPPNFLAEHPPAAVMRLTIASISRLSVDLAVSPSASLLHAYES
jgi:hypothetical protein